MSVLLAQGWSFDSLLMLFNFPKVCRSYSSVHGPSNDTLDVIWTYVCHDLKGLLTGMHQALDPYGCEWPVGSRQRQYAGQPLCQGNIVGLVWNLPLDLAYAANELGWPHWANVTACCGWCLANRIEHNARDVSRSATWRPLCYTLGTHDRIVLNHPIWRGLGITRFTYMGDLMHGGDLGPTLHLHGNTIKELIRPNGPCRFSNSFMARLQ